MTTLHGLRRRALPASVALYAASVVAPATTLLPGVPPDPALALGVAAGVAAVAFAGATAVDDLAAGLSSVSTPAALGGALLPGLGWLAVALGATAPGTPAAWVAVAGVASCLPAMAALWLAETETSRRRIDDATVHVRFGGDGPGRTALAGAAVAAIGAVGLAAAGLFDLFGDGVGTALFTSVATLVTAGSTVLSAAGDDEGGNEDDRDADGTDADDAPRAAVTDAGVRIGERFHGWETLEGYRLTDEEVEIRRDTWLHPTLSFERDDLDDVAAVVDALGRHLPRVDDEGRVETAAAPGHGRGLRDAAEATGGERESAAGRERERAE